MKNRQALRFILAYLKITIGAAIYSAGFQFFTFPNAIPTGGLTGVAMILNFLLNLPVGALTIVMNVPLFIFAWKKFGFQYMLASLIGMLLSSVLVDFFAGFPFAVTKEPLLAAIYGGIVKGFGLGLVYSAGGTTGGVDIIAKVLRKRYAYINFGTIILGMDVIVIVAFAITLDKIDSAMYGIITMFVTSKLVDLVLYGAVNSKSCYIISENHREISSAIQSRLHRGATLLTGEGAYTGEGKSVILCVIKTQQIVELRKIVKSIDEKAFVIVTDATEVFGQGFLSIDSEL
jgi:uncharacterized membrane-anchored protein YitT (DUF2179 family)